MAKRRKNKEARQGSFLVILAMIAVVLCGGAWNYQRNLALEAENQGARAFKGYTDEALGQLAEAYAEEADSLKRRYESAMARRQGARTGSSLISERVKEFERVRRDSDRLREVSALAAEKEARLRDIRTEQGYRRDKRDFDVHLRRLTSL